LHDALRGWIESGAVKSAHDCSEGGLAVALAECCISQLLGRDTPRLIGALVDLAPGAAPRESAGGTDHSAEANQIATLARVAPALRSDALLFGETQGRILISVVPHHAAKV